MPAAKSTAVSVKPRSSPAEPPALAKPGRVRLAKALATNPAPKPLSAKTPGKPKKSNGGTLKKYKLRSSTYKIPDDEYAQLTALKQHVLALGISAKKSELLRAGLMLLVALDDAQLEKVLAKLNFTRVRIAPKAPTRSLHGDSPR